MYTLIIDTVSGDLVELALLKGYLGLATITREESSKPEGQCMMETALAVGQLKNVLHCLRYKTPYYSEDREVKIWSDKDGSIYLQKMRGGPAGSLPFWKIDKENAQAIVNFIHFSIDSNLPADFSFIKIGKDDKVDQLIAEGIGFPQRRQTPEYWDTLGMCIGMRGDIALANRCFQRALELEPAFHRSKLNLAVNFERVGQGEEALRLILETPDGYPRRNVIYANTLSAEGRTDEAAIYYEKAAIEEPDFYVPYICLLQILQPAGGPAYEYWLELAVQHVRTSPRIGIYYARHLIDQGKFIELAFLEWIDQLQPVNDRLSVIGRAEEEPYLIAEAKLAQLVAQTYLDGDKEVLQNAVKALQTFPDGYNVCTYAKLLVSAAAQLGLPNLVKDSYQKVCPDCIASELGISRHIETVLSQAYAACEKPEEAVALCQKVLAEDPNDLQTLALYWSYLDDIDRMEEAITVAERVWEMNPEQAHILYNLGFMCAKQGLFGKAQYYYKKQIEIDPQHYMAIENLAFIELLQNQIDSAKKRFDDYCQKIRSVVGSPSEEWHTLATIMDDPDLEATHQEKLLESLAEGLQMKTNKFDHLVDLGRKIQGSPTFALQIQQANHADEPILGAYTGIERNPFSMENMLSSLSRANEAQLAEVRFQLEQQAKGDYSALLSRLIADFPVFQHLPSEAQSSFSEGEKRLQETNTGDFSLAVVAFSKAVEVALRRMVLDPYRQKYQYEIEIEHEINIKIIGKQRGAEKFIQFVEKGYFIGLGEMALALNLCNQPISLQAPCIGKLRAFIIDGLRFQLLLDPKTIENIAELARNYRNKAAHSASLDRNAAITARALSIGILSSFQPIAG